MKPADELHATAAELRTRAAAAAEDSGSSTWHTSRHFPDLPDSTYTTVWATGGKPLLGGGGGRGRPHPYVSAPVGDYIAAVDPTVGLALATWLEQTVRAVSEGRIAIPAEALAVARAINGSQP